MAEDIQVGDVVRSAVGDLFMVRHIVRSLNRPYLLVDAARVRGKPARWAREVTFVRSGLLALALVHEDMSAAASDDSVAAYYRRVAGHYLDQARAAGRDDPAELDALAARLATFEGSESWER